MFNQTPSQPISYHCMNIVNTQTSNNAYCHIFSRSFIDWGV